MRNFVKLSFLALTVSIAVACKKKSSVPGRVAQETKTADGPLATGFAVKSAIAIYESPEVRAKMLGMLPMGNPAAIFATRVPDKKEPEKAFWYKVRYAPLSAAGDKPAMPIDGFISEREEVLRQNFLVFNKKTEESGYVEGPDGERKEVKGVPGVMATTAVKLRKSPALNGPVIRILKNGEVLKVLEASSAVEIDNKTEPWYLVSDEKGETGYCFGGYLLAGLHAELIGMQDLGFQFSKGWVRILTNDVKPLRSPQGKDLYDLTNYHGTLAGKETGKLPKDMLLQVDGEITKTPEKRYRAMLRVEVERGYFEYFKFYLPKSKVQFIRDYFTLSRARANSVEPALAADINRYLGGDLNLECTTVTPFSGAGPDARHFVAIETAIGPADEIGEADGAKYCRGVLARSSLLAEEKDGKHVFLGQSNVGGAKFTDLDGDGVPELVSEQSHPRGGYSLEIFALKNQKLTPVFTYGGDRMGECVEMSFKNKYIVIDYTDYYAEQIKKGETPEACAEATTGLAERYKNVGLTAGKTTIPYYAKLENGRFRKTDKPVD